MERDELTDDDISDEFDFNSHAHVERDAIPLTFSAIPQISTHTLTWSVTARAFINPMFNGISTHTLTWSVTLWALSAR